MIHLRKFENEAAYEAATLNIPSVSVIEEDHGVKYDNEEAPSGPDANGHEYVDLGLPSGKLWSTVNIGADVPTGYGNFYTWGSTAHGGNSVCNWAHTPFNGGEDNYDEYAWYAEKAYAVDSNNVLLESVDIAHIEFGGDWRTPTRADFMELANNTTIRQEYDQETEVNGLLFIGRNNNSIFIPCNGLRNGDYDEDVNNWMCLWSSSSNPELPECAFVWGGDSSFYEDQQSRYYGCAIRPILYKK